MSKRTFLASAAAVFVAAAVGIGVVVAVGRDSEPAAGKHDGMVTGTVWVANEDGASLTAIDAGRNEVVTTLTGIEGPHNLQVSPDGKSVWAVSGHDSLAVMVDAQGLGLHGTVSTGKEPAHVVVTPDGRTAYTTNGADDTVSAIDIATMKAVATIRSSGSGRRRAAQVPRVVAGRAAHWRLSLAVQVRDQVSHLVVGENRIGDALLLEVAEHRGQVVPDPAGHVRDLAGGEVAAHEVEGRRVGAPRAAVGVAVGAPLRDEELGSHGWVAELLGRQPAAAVADRGRHDSRPVVAPLAPGREADDGRPERKPDREQHDRALGYVRWELPGHSPTVDPRFTSRKSVWVDHPAI